MLGHGSLAHQAGPLGEVVVDGLNGLDVVVDAGLARARACAAHDAHARQAQPRRASPPPPRPCRIQVLGLGVLVEV